MWQLPKLRKVCKWTGLVLSVLLFTVWVGSGRRMYSLHAGSVWELSISAGRIAITHWSDPAHMLNYHGWHSVDWIYKWNFEWFAQAAVVWKMTVPIWAPFLALAVPSVSLWRVEIMQVLSKWRTIAKWAATSVCVFLAAIWIASWWYFAAFGAKATFAIYEGKLSYTPVHFSWAGRHQEAGWLLEPLSGNPYQTFKFVIGGGASKEIALPLWPLVLVIAGGAFIAWRNYIVRSRRERVGLCAKCGYDIRGLKMCPECGTETL